VLLLGAAAIVSFRARRDLWFVAVVAAVVLSGPPPQPGPEIGTGVRRLIGLTATTLVALGLSFAVRGLTTARLEQSVRDRYPAEAVAFVRGQRLVGPVFNHFNW